MDPLSEYETRLRARRASFAEAERRDAWVANLRLLAAAAVVGVAIAVFGYHSLPPAWLLLPSTMFSVLVVVHVPVLAAKRRAERGVQFYERGLRRLRDEWQKEGRKGEEYLDKSHPYARDFDVFGVASLFQRLATLQTRTGEETLAHWLLNPPALDTGRSRQAAVRELQPQLDARERLAVDADTAPPVSATSLAVWGEAEPVPLRGRPLLLLLAAASAATAIAWLGYDQSPKPFLAVLMLVLITTRAFKARVDRITRSLAEPTAELKALVPVLQMLETAKFECPPLLAIQKRVHGSASVAIKQLAKRVDWFESRRNQVFAPIAYLLLWEPLFAFAFERWRAQHGKALRGWLEAAGEIEALHALGGYAYENPTDVFPELTNEPGVFKATGLAHPLLAKGVRNDVSLPRVLLISGSNMSGKSTMLRTIGANALLGLIGAPVRARQMSLSWCSLGATLRVEDSLDDGVSRFYAEVRRLKQLTDLAKQKPPLLFLLDEIMGGTNSHDRRVGTEAIVKELVAHGAFGVVTTHDLALTEMTIATNVHFEDQMVDERLAFDYLMRPGVVQKSNALALMKAAGLEMS